MRQLIMIVGLSLLLVIVLLAYGVSSFEWLDMAKGLFLLGAVIVFIVKFGIDYTTVTPISDKDLRDTGYISLICLLTSVVASGLSVYAFSRDGKEAGPFMAVILLLMIPVFFYGFTTLLAWIIGYLRKLIFKV